MKQTVQEPARTIPVLSQVDVLVAGGGVAGCAAAVSAARMNKRTLLVERNGCLGGVATASYMSNIGNRLFLGDGTQIVKGFTGELIERLASLHAATAEWKHPILPGCVIDSERLKVLLIELMEEAGVEVLTHTMAAEPVVEDRKVRGLFVECKEGRQAILAHTVVDTTGEADVAARAGAEVKHAGGTASTLFKLANVDVEKFIRFAVSDPKGFPSRRDRVKDAETFLNFWDERGFMFFPHRGGEIWKWLQKKGGLKESIDPAFRLNALGMYALKGFGTVTVNSNFYSMDDLAIRSLSQKELHSQKMCFYVGEFLIKNVPGFENSHIASMGVDLGIRTSRRIVGRTTLDNEIGSSSPKHPYMSDETIGCIPVVDESWSSGTIWSNDICEIPFGILVPRGPDNLLVASGKSASTEPAGVTRGMVACMTCGQAAGVASAIAAQNGISASEVTVRELQKELLKQGAYLGEQSRLEELGLK